MQTLQIIYKCINHLFHLQHRKTPQIYNLSSEEFDIIVVLYLT